MRPVPVLQASIVLVIAAFWIVVWIWTLRADPARPPGFLDDRAFPAAAEPICAEAVTAVEALGSAAAVDSIEERADLVDAQDDILRDLVVDLRALPRPTGEPGAWVAEWLDDWDVHIGDRERWAARLHEGSDPPFVETAKGNDQVSEAVDYFAETNEMPSCMTYNDV